jgi:hypothetical protein
LLRFKVKKGVLTEQNEVIPLGLEKDLLGWQTNILEELAGDICLGTSPRTVLQKLPYFVGSVHKQAGIMVHLVGASPKWHWLWLIDCWGIDNPQPDEHSARALRPLDTEFDRGRAVLRTIHPN